ncbi:hypothetical protein TSTA_061370 [Talaromyces stipitatus ATCC 10500]|uniref:Uncharacterized protein n=1 Tax=Talaromyces stipitatus (strain ATCC 10500 / CBS 375.48 / QM 6759 / NRRL 1006) TaxID=441959 RepID=B8LV26_TALSN|nr:uncharacterized protein TSTA_061370 [Talaromyces stipitatus ATCC 10500]EED22647.1 hypothetical protein TSTA_061370 [Talaromyces stipitatus ATCC 10500]
MDSYLYAIGTILSPQDKLQFFSTADWDPEEGGINYQATYHQSLESSLKKYSENLAQEYNLRFDSQFSLTSLQDILTASQMPNLEPSGNITKMNSLEWQGLHKMFSLFQLVVQDDDEEDEGLSTEPQATSHSPSTKALGKRRLRDIAKDVESDQENNSEIMSLPKIQHRVSGRVRKRSRLLDGYEM